MLLRLIDPLLSLMAGVAVGLFLGYWKTRILQGPEEAQEFLEFLRVMFRRR